MNIWQVLDAHALPSLTLLQISNFCRAQHDDVYSYHVSKSTINKGACLPCLLQHITPKGTSYGREQWVLYQEVCHALFMISALLSFLLFSFLTVPTIAYEATAVPPNASVHHFPPHSLHILLITFNRLKNLAPFSSLKTM